MKQIQYICFISLFIVFKGVCYWSYACQVDIFKSTMQSVCSDIQLVHTDLDFSEIVHKYRTKYNPPQLDRDRFLF